MSRDVQAEIQTAVSENPVLLFMKGNKLMPMCGFSATVIQCLNDVGAGLQNHQCAR